MTPLGAAGPLHTFFLPTNETEVAPASLPDEELTADVTIFTNSVGIGAARAFVQRYFVEQRVAFSGRVTLHCLADRRVATTQQLPFFDELKVPTKMRELCT